MSLEFWENNDDIKLFREYLRIPSVHPDVDYQPCVEFLQRQADALGLPIIMHYPAKPNKPVVIITWTGSDPNLKSIILNSHMDVVPAFDDHWTHPPFAAEMDDDGKIFARGAQDMKCIGIWYLTAIKYLRQSGVQLKRTVHMVFVPDEEIQSFDGMRAYIKTPEFLTLNGGFVLDESAPLETDSSIMFYGERTPRPIGLEITGTTGHGSLLHKNTAGEKVHYLINKFMGYRAEEMKKLEINPNLSFGDVTGINMTVLKGGEQRNVVPPTFKIEFDIRLSPSVDENEFEKMVEKWCEEAGGGIVIDYTCRPDNIKPTPIDDTNPFWTALKRVLCDDFKYKIKPIICPGNTDANQYRSAGIRAIGFTALKNMPCLFHAVDEYITAEQFLTGIDVYKAIIQNLANV